MNYVPRPYQPVHQATIPQPQFQQAADLVRLIEGQIPKISLQETLAVARCLGSDHGMIGSPHISNVTIARKNTEFSRGDSWFSVQWYEIDSHRFDTVQRSVNLRFEPGRQLCTSYTADGEPYQPPSPPSVSQQQSQLSQPPLPAPQSQVNFSQRQDTLVLMVDSPMEIDSPKHMNWPGLVGDLFDKAAVIVHDQDREKSETIDTISTTAEQPPSNAVWPLKAWAMIKAMISGHATDKGLVYQFGLPYVSFHGIAHANRHATIQVIVERCKSIVDVFLQPEDTHPVDSQQFINHPAAPVRKKLSLKVLAKVLSTTASEIAF